ncbi:CoA-binding protein [Candidatus Micrarchaeota archaeon]|nr:CoA-binding protein [Candidatus Micrarchaeota archaeon]
MSILVNKNTKVIVQGITGREASGVVKDMLAYGTKVVAGVTPGKGGLEVEGVPVYDSFKEAMQNHEANTALVYVPPFAAKEAVFEAVSNGIKVLDVITERVPVRDSVEMISFAKKHEARIIGPTSVGIITPGECKLGPIGGSNPDRVFAKGNVGVVSKSGGMTNETSWLVRQAGFGQSTAAGIGGDFVTGTSFAEFLQLFEQDKETKAIVLFGELGGVYEEQAAELIKKKIVTKPVIAFVAGKFSELMPQDTALGHAGAIIEGGLGTPSSKIKALKDAGALVARVHGEIPELLKQVL